jgi:hypothetical protein
MEDFFCMVVSPFSPEAVQGHLLVVEHCNPVMAAERDDTSDTRQVAV